LQAAQVINNGKGEGKGVLCCRTRRRRFLCLRRLRQDFAEDRSTWPTQNYYTDTRLLYRYPATIQTSLLYRCPATIQIPSYYYTDTQLLYIYPFTRVTYLILDVCLTCAHWLAISHAGIIEGYGLRSPANQSVRDSGAAIQQMKIRRSGEKGLQAISAAGLTVLYILYRDSVQILYRWDSV